MKTVNADTLADLADNAVHECGTQVLHNLVLGGVFPYAEAESDFVMDYDTQASEWQNTKKPDSLWINHGEYIHTHGDGRDFLAQELRNKPDSNRACLSLICMEHIAGSHDEPIPSFMVLQFGFPTVDRSILLVTAYFRALEVKCFLPINLSEIAQYIRFLKLSFPAIVRFELTVIAFKAYARENFNCLRKSAIDTVSPAMITHAVGEKRVDQIAEWLDSKINVEESVVCFDGLKHLSDAMLMYKAQYNDRIRERLSAAIDKMNRLQTMRQASSYGDAIAKLSEEIRSDLVAVRKLLV
jgi:hypothetical protein